MFSFPSTRLVVSGVAALALSGCMALQASQAVPGNAGPQTQALAQAKDDLNALVAQPGALRPSPLVLSGAQPVQPFTGVGFAQVATQPGKTLNERRLMAIQAARLAALRELTEQIHGVQISAETTLKDQVLRDDRLRAVVQGELRGARTLRITPKDGDSFEVVMQISADTVRYILRAAKLGV